MYDRRIETTKPKPEGTESVNVDSVVLGNAEGRHYRCCYTWRNRGNQWLCETVKQTVPVR